MWVRLYGCTNCGTTGVGIAGEDEEREVMGALSLLLAKRGLGTWQEGRGLENTRERLAKEREAAKMSHEVASMAETVSAEGARRVAREREAASAVEPAAKRQDADGVERAERLMVLLTNLDVTAKSVRGAKMDAETVAAREVVAMAHEEVKMVESLTLVSP